MGSKLSEFEEGAVSPPVKEKVNTFKDLVIQTS
jgi:hypothetical protein